MAKYEEWLKEDSLTLIQGWARDGLTDEQISKNMGIAYSTFKDWKKKFSALSDALKESKAVADYIIENELYMSAQTRTMTVRKPIKVKVTKKDGQKMITEERIEYVDEEIVLPANVTAQIYWLKNRKPDKWRDRPEVVIAETFEDDGLLAALDAQIDEAMEDDSWLIESGDE